MKCEPCAVKVNVGLPAVTEDGVTVESVGGNGIITKFTFFEVTPAGLTTAICAVPASVTRLAATGALSWVGLMYLVVSDEAFQRITCPGKKPDPFAIKTKSGFP